MSPPSTQQGTRRIRRPAHHIRVSDAERNAVAELLGRHYADGRLDQAEFDDRVGRTMAAKTRGDLSGLFDDFRETGPAGAAPPGPGGPGAVQNRGPRRRGGIVRPLLLLLLVFICANFAWHAFTSLFFIQPLVWAFVIVAVILLVNRSAHRHDR